MSGAVSTHLPPLNNLRWAVIGLIFCATLVSYIDRQTVSVMAPVLCKDLSMTNTQYGAVGSCFLFAYALSMWLWGGVFDKVGSAPDFDQAAVKVANARCVTRGKAKHQLGGDVGQARQQRHHAQHAQRLHARTRRPVGAQDHAVRAFEFQRSLGGGDGHALIAVVHDFNGA
jgi:hypothetical protein